MALIRAVLMLGMICAAATAEEIVVREVLVLDRVGRYGRSPVFVDPVERGRVMGKWETPVEGDVVVTFDGREAKWRAARAGEDGWISGESLAGGYALASVDVDSDRVMILEASGHGMVFVNGEPRAGDPYEYGFVRLPVLLRKGSNELLFAIARGRLRAKLTDPPKDVYPDPQDATTPDFFELEEREAWFAVPYINATTQPVKVPARIPPLSIRKIPLKFKYDGKGQAARDPATGVAFRVRRPSETFKRTFISEIDGSAQYYAVNPAADAGGDQRALVLSLHGASVEAIGQADGYSSKSSADIVCPTNRRPYGFDWEDWGRLDAIEVLDDANNQFRPDPSQIYLTGHSMGGHGTWSIGALFPDQFAAIGPSAGWISFSTYATTQATTQPTSSIIELMKRCASTSDTETVIPNLAHLGVYILHGADDDNVPVAQARQMVEHLSKFHKDFIYYEQPNAGHWWDVSDEPGADCVDWAPMFDFFARHRRPRAEELREISFVTPSPGVSAQCHWITIEAQQRAIQPSSIQIRVDPAQRRYVGTTMNVQRLAIDLVHLLGVDPIQIELDGQKLSAVEWSMDGRIWLARDGSGWRVIDKPSPALKGPHRGGPLKDAFRNRMMFVYGTKGTPEENAWALAKARYDAETWWYRGNGSVDVIPDVEFDPRAEVDRNVILYGIADTLSCWRALLGDSPVQIKRGEARIGTRTETGEDLACLFVRPRPLSDCASVAVIGGTGLVGMKLTDRLPVFLSGVAYPDVTLLDPSVLESGTGAIRCAGFFGNDWSIGKGEFVWTALRRP